ncbi:type II secretion system F family protein [Jiella sp. MQZ9-1]|uniref:Type II secretion system F family protein n=1 Tax=Jiella flava TaxID=2816857 RepID=A0A939G184_9HYPH|nr:type II secretion system F family protein [Jiella flava]MBO0663688.1 type II secretion system F family protein [Jiella flava]MCD2472261.1 type II secretion system F family protein [Jiella flava]
MEAGALILFVLLSTVAAGGLAFAVLQPRLARDKRVAQRRNVVSRNESDRKAHKVQRDRLQEQVKRRRSIQNSLKELEARQKERDKNLSKLPLKRRMEQAGWKISVGQFVAMSFGFGLFATLISVAFGLPLLVIFGIVVIAGLGLPRFLLSRSRKKRFQAFTQEFPTAIDLIVRGVKSGLPLNDTLKMIAGETSEPVRSEFRRVVESQQMGMSMADSVERLYRNIPTPEVNFFVIVIGIQAQAGGNLSEALGNLSRVLRERKKMRDKVQAVSMEAKASAGIIGALPVVVFGLVTLTNPAYISLLYTNVYGKILLGISAIWMLLGVLMMKKMINFDI